MITEHQEAFPELAITQPLTSVGFIPICCRAHYWDAEFLNFIIFYVTYLSFLLPDLFLNIITQLLIPSDSLTCLFCYRIPT